MRAYIKKRLKEVLHSMLEVHHQGLETGADEIIYQTLQECQKTAISIGKVIEDNFEDPSESISVLEKYCEALYQLSLQIPFCSKAVEELDGYIQKVIQNTEKEPTKILVVFFPYKASMWDSLESIWEAASEDKRCECMVVPIPYFKLENGGQKVTYTYEGIEFPEYVPIIDYRKFSVEKEHPEIVYVHNPYDNYNYVTSVHPDYYSGTLKQYVEKLIYVPYYVTSGSVSEHHKYLSVYENMDYMVVQSKHFKEGFFLSKYYNKILPFGSPKFDRIIKLSRSGVKMQKQWESIIGNKHAVMLNTSINCFLTDGEVFIKKLWNIFKLSEEEKNVVLIWRPHPLLEATIKSMRRNLLESYQELKDFFVSHKIGILDETPDITKTVVQADAYMGESESSVVSLFDVAGKPILILNNYIYREATNEERKRIKFMDAVYNENKWWLVSSDYNGLFCVSDENWDQVDFVGRVEGENKWTCAYSALGIDGDYVRMCPFDALEAVDYNRLEHKFIQNIGRMDRNISAIKMFNYGKSIFYLSIYQNLILERNLETGEWTYHEHVYPEREEGKSSNIRKYIWDAVSDGKYLFMSSAISNKVIRFNMKDKKAVAYGVGVRNKGFSGIICDSEHIYLADMQTGNIECINKQMKYVCSLRMPKEFRVMDYGKSMLIAHDKLIDAGEWIITIPFNGNGIVKINKEKRTAHMLVPQFWDGALNISNGYAPWKRGVAAFARFTPQRTLLVQRLFDGGMAQIDIVNEVYNFFYPCMSEDAFSRFTDGQDGFEKTDDDNNFSCRESVLFSIKKFLSFLVDGDYSSSRKAQLEALPSLSADLEGTCGKKVHEFIIKELCERDL